LLSGASATLAREKVRTKKIASLSGVAGSQMER